MELARIQRDLDSLPAEETRRKKRLDDARATHDAAVHEFNQAQVRSRESEKGIAAADQEIKKLEGRLNEVKNNAEYQATLFQIESVRKERSTLEEEGLAALDKVESMKDTAAEWEAKLKAEETTFEEFRAKAGKLLAEAEAERVEVAKSRDALVDGIQRDLLEKYESIFSFRDGNAVSAVEGEHCTGCYTKITPNDMARLMGASGVVQCNSCQRLLYLAES